MPGFFSDLVRERVAPAPKSKVAVVRPARPPVQSNLLGLTPEAIPNGASPCDGCPARGQPQTLPSVPPESRIAYVGAYGSDALDAARSAVGVEPAATALATRCDPSGRSKAERDEMVRRCGRYLRADLRDLPAVAVGDDPVFGLMEARDHDAAHLRGLWRLSPGGRRVFALLPGSGRFAGDAARCARTLEPGGSRLRSLEVIVDPESARAAEVLGFIEALPGPWAFDIESYDAAEFPGRREVATDPCHPDFRVRGVAIAWSEDEGAWFELCACGSAAWRLRLDRVFGSAALKVAHNGPMDEDGLVFNGWVSEVVNRGGDSMLEWLALSDGRHVSVSLERLAVDVLGIDQWWDSFDKSTMRDAATELVARSAVFDAGTSLWLHCHARDMMEAGLYWDGS